MMLSDNIEHDMYMYHNIAISTCIYMYLSTLSPI